jgi:rod shape-determining protein MreD
MFILILPAEIPAALTLLLSFGIGITIDFYSGSSGMHAFASTFAGFVRPYVLRSISPRDGFDPGVQPSMANYGFRWFMLYAAIIVFIHHTALFFIETFKVMDFVRTFTRVILSSVFSLIFILLVLAQVLLFNNIQFSGYVNPYVYIMFILLLPAEIPAALALILSFGIGITIDFYSGSAGMHAFASTFAGFVRPFVLRSISPRDGYKPRAQPAMVNYGFRWFLLYTAIIVFVHHITLFFVEAFRIIDFFRTFLRVILSSAFSLIFITLIEFYRKGR